METHRFSLAHLGLSDHGPIALIEAAATHGFRAVGLPLRSGALRPLKFEIVNRPDVIRAIVAACRATGIGIFDVEAMVLGREPPDDELRRFLSTAAELGASRISCLGPEHGGDETRRFAAADVDRLARLCGLSAEFGLHVAFEFMMFRTVRTLDDATAIVTAAAQPNLGIIVDALHLARSGGTPTNVAALPPALISHCQICDAPAVAPADLVEEARHGRLLPGDGDLMLRDLCAALPECAPLAMEIPIRAHAGMTVTERVRRAATALARL